MTTPLHDSSEKILKQGSQKPASLKELVGPLRELVIEVAQQLLAQDSTRGPLPLSARARLQTRLAIVTQSGYPNKWSRAIDIDRQGRLDLDPEDPGHGSE